MRKSGVFARILASFAFFALGLAFVMGTAAYFTAGNLSRELLAARSSLILQTLIEAEKLARDGQDSQFEAKEFVSALHLKFFVGKQLAPEWAALPDGLHLIDNSENFLLLKHADGIGYALCGSTGQGRVIFANIVSMLFACAVFGIVAAIGLAFLLARRLARPLQELSLAIDSTETAKASPIPDKILARKDEIGCLARAIGDYQQKTRILLEREKSFTSAASHELRTPLSVLSSGLEILSERAAGDAKARQIPENLLRTTNNMSLTVSALLCLARGEKQDPETVDPAQILAYSLREFVSMNKIFAEQPGNLPCEILTSQGIKVFIRGEAHPVSGNKDLAAITLRNLLENAFRHGDGKQVHIDLSPSAILIRNRSGKSAGKNVDSGFGLLIAQRACERMNWRLSHKIVNDENLFRLDLPPKNA